MFTAVDPKSVNDSYELAKASYARLGIDVDAAIKAALTTPISLHCWQTDDVAGLETKEEATSGGGIMATGNYPGRSRNGDEIRADLDKVMARVVRAGLLLVGKIVEDLFAGEEVGERPPAAPRASLVDGDLDGGSGLCRLVPLCVGEDLGLVEQAHLIGHGPLAAGTEVLALEKADVLLQLADLLAVLGDGLLMLLDLLRVLGRLLCELEAEIDLCVDLRGRLDASLAVAQ